MKVLMLQDNLMWSARLERSLKALGHEPTTLSEVPDDLDSVDLALVNLSGARFSPEEAIERLRAAGVYVIAHAGHKEKPKLQVGRESGADRVATNSEVTFKLETLLAEAAKR
jgi:DNA-binding response OmpR family regulator